MKHIFDHAGTIRVPTSNGLDLLWRDDLGIGFLPSTGMSYGDDYWNNYQKYATSLNAKALNDARVSFVKRNVKALPYPVWICDVGIGNGQFVSESFSDLGLVMGHDVNPRAIEWLKSRNLYGDPYTERFQVLTFWDVLEHVDDPRSLLNAKHIFVSLPIHRDLPSLLASKHLKPNEHLWHFTQEGFITFMDFYGYRVQEINDSEVRAGRESIGSFYFMKVAP